jgi:hypothetical protein
MVDYELILKPKLADNVVLKLKNHGNETRSKRNERSKVSAKLAVLEEGGFSIGPMSGGRTRGRRPVRITEVYPEFQALLKVQLQNIKSLLKRQNEKISCRTKPYTTLDHEAGQAIENVFTSASTSLYAEATPASLIKPSMFKLTFLDSIFRSFLTAASSALH